MRAHPFLSLRAVFLVALATFLPLVSPAFAADDAAESTAERNEGPLVGTVMVPSGLNQQEVQAVVLRSLLARRWIIREKADEKVVAHYERGKNTATLTIRFDEKQVEIFGVGSGRRGEFPIRWVENLKKDIGVFLGQAIAAK